METTVSVVQGDLLKQVAEKILLKRRQLKMTQKELILKAGISGPLLVSIETGQSNVGVNKLNQVTQALGMRLIIDAEDMNVEKAFI